MKILTALKLDGRYYNNKYLGLTKKKKKLTIGKQVTLFQSLSPLLNHYLNMHETG